MKAPSTNLSSLCQFFFPFAQCVCVSLSLTLYRSVLGSNITLSLEPLPSQIAFAQETHVHMYSHTALGNVISRSLYPRSGILITQKTGLIFFNFIFWADFFFLFVQYSALLHLPPLRFHCADGCWDRTQDRCNLCIGSQTLKPLG